MASSVNRRIKTDLVSSLGHRDPAGMIRPRSTDPIRARGHVPQIQAGHMTASDRQSQNAKKPLLAGGHPHMTTEVSRDRHACAWRGHPRLEATLLSNCVHLSLR